MNIKASLLGLILGCLAALPASAASVQVEPALIDIAAPQQASALSLRDVGTAPVTVQIRVFRWTQAKGAEALVPATDVIASPPAVTLSPGAPFTVRVVRVAKQPVAGEASYRLLIDELPDRRAGAGSAVKLLIRQSIPVFFGAADKSPPKVSWTVERLGSQVVVTARNSGDTRLRIAGLALRDADGRSISFGAGLLGYVLGHAVMSWKISDSAGFAATGPVTISAQGAGGAIRATANGKAAP